MTAIASSPTRKAEIVDRLVGDRGGDDDPVADIDPDMRRRRAFANLDDSALDLIARAELHCGSPVGIS